MFWRNKRKIDFSPVSSDSRHSQKVTLKGFVIPPNSKLEKLRRTRLLYAGWLTNLSRFQGARPDHVWVESCCSPWELVSFDP